MHYHQLNCMSHFSTYQKVAFYILCYRMDVHIRITKDSKAGRCSLKLKIIDLPKTLNNCEYCRVTLNSRDPIVRLGIASLPNNPKRNLKSFPLGLIQAASQNLQPSIRNLQDLYVSIANILRYCQINVKKN